MGSVQTAARGAGSSHAAAMVQELGAQSRLARARFRHDPQHLTAGAGPVQRRLQQRHVAIAPDKGGQAAGARTVEAGAERSGSLQVEHADRLDDALDVLAFAFQRGPGLAKLVGEVLGRGRRAWTPSESFGAGLSAGAAAGTAAPSAAMASSSRRRCPTKVTPRSLRSSAVRLGRTLSSISLSRKAGA
jgi:hypothetical protein